MKWLRENRFLGTLLIAFSLLVSGDVWFLLSAKSDWDDAVVRFNETIVELNRLERLAPYPNGENLRQIKGHVDGYASALARLKEELKTQVASIQPLAPTEFQSRLRLAMSAVADRAQASKVRLPDKFYLGFDEFASGLPNTLAAPLLGQELAQIEWLLDALFDARVDALTSFRRTRLREEQGAASPSSTPASRKPGAIAVTGPKSVERNIVEATFVSTPEAARKVLNQIAGANQQFLIVRLLHIRNEKDKGPPREASTDPSNAVAVAASPVSIGSPDIKPALATALNFIVGNERIEVTAKIEMVRFTF